MKKILPEDLVALDDYAGKYPVTVDLVYAQPDHKDNMFREAIYRKGARMWCHRDFAPVIIRASEICHAAGGYSFSLKDCLRTVEAQVKIADSAIVRAHPQWLQEPRLFSLPGKGGHPRGMAIDIVLVDKNGAEVDMGTPFDYLTADKSHNPAARDFLDFGKGDGYNELIFRHRKILEDAMMQAAHELGRELYPLPQEWWDFRFTNDYISGFAPLSDADLPPHMRMT